MSKRRIRGFSNEIIPVGPPAPGDIFDNPTNSTFSTFEYSGWGGTVANPITSSDFTTYNNSATSSYEYSGWGGTVFWLGRNSRQPNNKF